MVRPNFQLNLLRQTGGYTDPTDLFGHRLGSWASQTAGPAINNFGASRGAAATIAGAGALLNGSNAGGIIGSVTAPLALGGAANAAWNLAPLPAPVKLAGKFLTNTIALPMLGNAVGSGTQNLLGGLVDRVGTAAAAGGEADLNRKLNPTNSLGAIIDNATSGMSKQSREYAELLRQMNLNAVDAQALGVQKVAIPLLNHQANLRAKMLPLDTAARLAQQSNQNIGQMFNTSIAGTSGIAQQIAANNPYGQVMI